VATLRGTVAPSIYRVSISHRRSGPVTNSFRYRSYMWLFDVDQPPRLPAPLRALARYRPGDHVDVRATLRSAGIEAERIFVLTNLRVAGYVFNPISVYWCYSPTGRLLAHVAEVHNTYGGRHAYVLPVDDRPIPGRPPVTHTAAKELYVSPFYPVDGSYRIRVSDPNEALSVSVTLDRPGGDPFRATLTGRRLPATTLNLLRSAARYPAAPLLGRGLIQYQGVKLWRRGLEVQPR
jgi:DUF1365 family protein